METELPLRFWYLEQQLILGDALDGFDEGGGDGVGQAVSPLDLLHTQNMLECQRTNSRCCVCFPVIILDLITSEKIPTNERFLPH